MKQKWNDPPSVMIYLTDGKLAQSSINGFSFEDKSAHAFVHGREFRVMPLPAPWQSIGYGEIVAVTLQSGRVIQTVLQPHEYEHHIAYIDVGAIDLASQRLHNPSDIITSGKEREHRIIAWWQAATGWRELTEQEYQQELRAIDEDMADMERIKREWQDYRED